MSGFNLPPGCSVSDIPGNRPEDEAAERISELEDCLKSAVAALQPFALAFTETRQVSSIPDEKVWLWKPSDSNRETNGISRAHLKTAADVLAQIAIDYACLVAHLITYSQPPKGKTPNK